MEEKPAGGLSLTQVFGGALAAVTAAVAASFLGVAGTLIGAAVGSVVSTIAATLYSNSLTRAARVSRTLVVKQTLAPAAPRPEPVVADPPGEPRAEGHPVRDTLWQRVRWKPVLLAAAGVFVAAVAVITVAELALGHPIANAGKSGTTLTNLGGSSRPSGGTTPTGTPTSTSGSASPTASPFGGSTPTGSTPSPSGTASTTPSSSGAPGTTAPTTASTTAPSTATTTAPTTAPTGSAPSR